MLGLRVSFNPPIKYSFQILSFLQFGSVSISQYESKNTTDGLLSFILIPGHSHADFSHSSLNVSSPRMQDKICGWPGNKATFSQDVTIYTLTLEYMTPCQTFITDTRQETVQIILRNWCIWRPLLPHQLNSEFVYSGVTGLEL